MKIALRTFAVCILGVLLGLSAVRAHGITLNVFRLPEIPGRPSRSACAALASSTNTSYTPPFTVAASSVLESLSHWMDAVATKPAEWSALWRNAEAAYVLRLIHLFREARDAHQDCSSYLDLISDAEFLAVAQGKRDELAAQVEGLRSQLVDLLIPSPHDSCLVEIHSGSGSTSLEGHFYVSTLSGLYTEYAWKKGLNVEIVSSEAGAHGPKRILMKFRGKGASRAFAYEGGVHRFRTGPATHHHVNVGVLPVEEQDERDLERQFPLSEFKVTSTLAGGHGGQNVQKTSTAAEVLHIPSGETITISRERQLNLNTKIALATLRERLSAKAAAERRARAAAARDGQLQVGTKQSRARNYDASSEVIIDDHLETIKVPLRGDVRRFDLASLVRRIEDRQLANILDCIVKSLQPSPGASNSVNALPWSRWTACQ